MTDNEIIAKWLEPEPVPPISGFVSAGGAWEYRAALTGLYSKRFWVPRAFDTGPLASRLLRDRLKERVHTWQLACLGEDSYLLRVFSTSKVDGLPESVIATGRGSTEELAIRACVLQMIASETELTNESG